MFFEALYSGQFLSFYTMQLEPPKQVLGLATLQEQIALDPSTSVGLAGQSKKPAKILSELAEVLACELMQVHHELGGGNSLSLLRPASLKASGLPPLLLLLPTEAVPRTYGPWPGGL